MEKLVALVPPPAEPTAADGDWSLVEADLGKKLPADWKALIARYGYGQFADFLHVFSPFFAPCPMMAQARGMLDADRTLQKAVPTAVPFVLYPEKDGALPWAQSDNGDAVYSITWSDDPSEWAVAVFNPRGGKLEMFEGGATGFLHGWLSGEQKVPGFPSKSDLPQPPCFDRWLERAHATIQLQATEPSGPTYVQRLHALLAGLSPVERRGDSGSEDDEENEKRQVHFVTDGGDCRFTYDTIYGHNIRIAAPPARMEAIQAKVLSVLPAMGCAKK